MNIVEYAIIVKRNVRYATGADIFDNAELAMLESMHRSGERPSKCAAIMIDNRQPRSN